MVCAAMLPWQFFANALSLASQSVVNNANLISKIYFPRMIVPASSIVVSLVDFLVACSILVGLMVWYHFWPTWRMLVLPALVLLAIAAALGPGLDSNCADRSLPGLSHDHPVHRPIRIICLSRRLQQQRH